MIKIKKNFFFIFTLLIISKNYSQDNNNMINTNYVNGEQQKTVAEIIFQNSLTQNKKMYFFSKNLFVDNKLFKYFLNFYLYFDVIFFLLMGISFFIDLNGLIEAFIVCNYLLNSKKKKFFDKFFNFIEQVFFVLIIYIFFKNYYNQYNSYNFTKQFILNTIKTNNYKSIFSFIKLLIIFKIYGICVGIIINNSLHRKEETLDNCLKEANIFFNKLTIFIKNYRYNFRKHNIFIEAESIVKNFNTKPKEQKKKFISQLIIPLKSFMIYIIQLILYIYILYKNNIINNNKNNVMNILKSQIEILQRQEKNPNNPLTEKELEILNIKLIMNNDIIQLENNSNTKPSENNKTNFFKKIDGLDYIFGVNVLYILYYIITL